MKSRWTALLFLAALVLAGADARAERNLSGQPAAAKVARAAGPPLSTDGASLVRLAALGAETVAAIQADNRLPGARPVKLGLVRDLSRGPYAESGALAWNPVSGGHAARWQVEADGAAALRIQVVVAHAPPGVRVRFAAAGEAHSADLRSPSSGTLWGPIVKGGVAIVEIFAPDGIAASAISIALGAVAEHTIDPMVARTAGIAKSAAAPACEVDFTCVAASDPALARAGASVSRLTYVSRGYVWACTGTLLNPGDGSFTPYYYTAAHCIPDQATADTVVTLWFDDASTCGGANARDPVQVDGGAELLVVDAPLDGALLRLNNMPPEGAVYAGWDSLPADAGAPILGIHHPEGGLKKVSEGTESGYADERFLAASWAKGLTADGSSGSALFTAIQSPRADYLVRGALVGGTSECTASGPQGFDLYTRFDLIWPKLAPYLSADRSGANYSGVWWNPGEPGWGLEVSHQQGAVMAALFTYSEEGDPQWFIGASLAEQADGSFTGALYKMSGPRFDASPWTRTEMGTAGTMTLTFSGTDAGRLTYTIGGKTVTKVIAPMPAGPGQQPLCTFTTVDRAKESNHQDLWWDPSESGWGVAVAEQGGMIFAVLFTYGDDGAPLWLAAPGLERAEDGTFAGTLYRTGGPAFDAAWRPASVAPAGTLALAFANGNSATLSYSIGGRAVTKAITRIASSSSAPACR